MLKICARSRVAPVFCPLTPLSGLSTNGNQCIQTRGLRRPPVNQTQLTEGRRTGALGMKVGMLSIFDKWGVRIPITVLQLDNVHVVQQKTEATDGYNALQLSIGEAKKNKTKLTLQNHYDKAQVYPGRQLQEFQVTPDQLLPTGTRISAMHFVPGQLIDVAGISKGKGFAGVMKRWNFKGGRATHGNSLSHRSHGSTGQSQDPGRTFKGKKMAGRLGGERVTMQNLKIVKIDPTRDLLYVHGAIPGNKGGFVRIVDAVKGPFYPKEYEVPRPTYKIPPEGIPTEVLWAPAGDKDPGIRVTPEDAY